MPNIIVPETPLIVDLKSKIARAPLPIKRTCPDLCPPFNFPKWENIRCENEQNFCIPFLPGDIIPIQTALQDLLNPDPNAPAVGWSTAAGGGINGYVGLQILDSSGAVVIDNITGAAAEYWTSYGPDGILQTAFIDTDLVGLDNFSIRINQYAPGELEPVAVVESEPFCLAKDCTILIEGSGFSCCGNSFFAPANYIGTSNKAFYYSARVDGWIKLIGMEKSHVLSDSGAVVSTKIEKSYRLETFIIPPYYAQLLFYALSGTVEIAGLKFEAQNINPSFVTTDTNELCINADLFVICETC